MLEKRMQELGIYIFEPEEFTVGDAFADAHHSTDTLIKKSQNGNSS